MNQYIVTQRSRDFNLPASGVPEISYYAARRNPLDSVGKALKPRVYCTMQLQNRGAGIPDGGLFTAEQLYL